MSAFIPKILKTEEDYEATLKRIEEIFDAVPGTPEGDEMELLVHLVEIYEDENYPISAPDPISAIKFRMEQQSLKNKDLIPYIGSKSKVSEVLSGKRTLSISMIRKLHESLDIPLESLIKEPEKKLSA
ncbi:MAG: DNA-binding protein [Treponema sp.]|nr:DNA-binding protein [Treponema sp.]